MPAVNGLVSPHFLIFISAAAQQQRVEATAMLVDDTSAMSCRYVCTASCLSTAEPAERGSCGYSCEIRTTTRSISATPVWLLGSNARLGLADSELTRHCQQDYCRSRSTRGAQSTASALSMPRLPTVCMSASASAARTSSSTLSRCRRRTGPLATGLRSTPRRKLDLPRVDPLFPRKRVSQSWTQEVPVTEG
jgi:hypothetical protein